MSFALDLSKFQDIAKNRMNTVARKAFIELSKEIIETSPVDEGRFRANWFPELSGFSDEVTDDTNEEKAKARVVTTIDKFRADKHSSMTLSNNLDYATAIEFGQYGTKNAGSEDSKVTQQGFSKKAPAGVVGVNILRWSKYIDDQVGKVK